jgi:hypothetical protein
VPVWWRVRVGVVASQQASQTSCILLLPIRASVYVVEVLWPATRDEPTDIHHVQWRSVSGGCVDLDITCLSHNTHTQTHTHTHLCHLSSLPHASHSSTSTNLMSLPLLRQLQGALIGTHAHILELVYVGGGGNDSVCVPREKKKNHVFRVSLVLMTLQHLHPAET